MQRDAAQIRQWLAEHPDDRKGSKGTTRKSNRSDNESAKMATSKNVIQGYTGVAAVDSRHQIIVEAQAHFSYDAATGTCVCPEGKTLYQNGAHCIYNGYTAVKFQGAQRDCVPYLHRDQCLRTPDKTKTRQVAFFQGKAPGTSETYSDRMKRRSDSAEGKPCYGRRFATVEPVCGNLRTTIKVRS